MPAIPLLLSLPPRLSRKARDGAEIGDTYQAQCAQSWRAAGFDPVSINSAQELADNPALQDRAEKLGIRIVPVDRDGRAYTDRPQVYLRDMLRVADELTSGGVFALTNADIIFPDPQAAHALAAKLKPSTFAALPRIDVAALGDASGQVNQHGFDLFVAHAADTRDLLGLDLIIGAPWWDHYLPVLLRIAGARRIRHDGVAIAHLDHDERWSWELWRALGHRFAGAVRDHAIARGVQYYAAALGAALTQSPGLQAALENVSRINLAFLQEDWTTDAGLPST